MTAVLPPIPQVGLGEADPLPSNAVIRAFVQSRVETDCEVTVARVTAPLWVQIHITVFAHSTRDVFDAVTVTWEGGFVEVTARSPAYAKLADECRVAWPELLQLAEMAR